MLQIQQTKKQYMKKMWSNASNLLAQTFIASTLKQPTKIVSPVQNVVNKIKRFTHNTLIFSPSSSTVCVLSINQMA